MNEGSGERSWVRTWEEDGRLFSEPRVRRALAELPPLAQRVVCWRHGAVGYSDQQIARHLGWPVEMVVRLGERAAAVIASAAVEEAA